MFPVFKEAMGREKCHLSPPSKRDRASRFLVERGHPSLLEINRKWKEDGLSWVIQPESIQEELSGGGAATWTSSFLSPFMHCFQAPTCLV